MVKIKLIYASESRNVVIYVRQWIRFRLADIIEIVNRVIVNGKDYSSVDQICKWVITDIAKYINEGEI